MTGFLAAATSLTLFCGYTVITGLLVAEVTINFIRDKESGDRGVNGDIIASSAGKETPATSLTSMALSLGVPRLLVIIPYLLLHFPVLVAHISKTSLLLSGWIPGLNPAAAAAAFTATLGGACFALPQRAMDFFNGVLVAAMMASFLVSVC